MRSPAPGGAGLAVCLSVGDIPHDFGSRPTPTSSGFFASASRLSALPIAGAPHAQPAWYAGSFCKNDPFVAPALGSPPFFFASNEDATPFSLRGTAAGCRATRQCSSPRPGQQLSGPPQPRSSTTQRNEPYTQNSGVAGSIPAEEPRSLVVQLGEHQHRHRGSFTRVVQRLSSRPTAEALHATSRGFESRRLPKGGCGRVDQGISFRN